MRAIAAPASLKGVLSAVAAAEALAAGLRAGGADAIPFPVADGGDGTLDVLGGEVRVCEVSGGLGELLLAAAADPGARSLLVGLGGTVTVDGGAGLREVVEELPLPTRVACDVMSPLRDAVRVFARQKGAREEDLDALAARLDG